MTVSMREHLGEPEPERDREPGEEPGQPTVPPKPKHRATYARDTRKGGYMIRVAGPYPEKFADRDVPVTTKAGGRHTEHLTTLIWVGTDRESGDRVALYQFEAKPREVDELNF